MKIISKRNSRAVKMNSITLFIFAVLAVTVKSNINVTDFSSKRTFQVTTFQELRDFKTLGIVNSSMPVLAERTIDGLPNLEELYFVLAQVKHLEPHCFQNVPNLRMILLTANPIEEITSHVFNHLPLRQLTLRNNSISRIQSSAFNDMPFLEHVDLSLNWIEQIDLKWFENSGNVRELSLAGNLIGEVPDRAFPNIVGVKVINLADNKIEVVRPEAFHGLARLTKLDLSMNRISEIPGSAFRDVRGVMLKAIDNELRCLPEMVLEAIKFAMLLLNRLDEECKQKIRQFKKTHPQIIVFY